jgi:glycosyltransferase involved in cell wall biosynthesis
VGGIAAHVYELSKALCELGHQVNVITRSSGRAHGSHETVGPMGVFPMRLRWIAPMYGWQINRFIESKVSELEPDVIHLHGMAPLEGYKVTGIPLVYTNHTSGYLQRIQKGGMRRMALLRRLLRKPQLFLAPSRELLEVPFEIPAEKVFIPNGVDAGKYRFREDHRREVRASLGLADEDVVGILTRRMVEKNGVIYLARATALVRSERLKIILIGDGPEYQRVAECLGESFPGRFFLLGAKGHDDIIPFYSAADLSILPSLMEATSISGLEAMSTSLPLVGTRVGGIPDLIEEGRNGHLCDPADEADLASKIDLLVSQDLQAFGAHSRSLVEERFAWPRIARKTEHAYEQVL